MIPTGYDLIARFYDDDMGRNMRFDDASCYAQLCIAGAPVLELGAGTGRITRVLVGAGLDVTAVDASAPMLAQLQRSWPAALPLPRLHVATLQQFAPDQAYGTVLLPYSLVTYLTAIDERRTVLQRLAAGLQPGGRLVLDAFVPRATAVTDGWVDDYDRATADGRLHRQKRLTPQADGSTWVERRYHRLTAAGEPIETIATRAVIRACTPDELRALAGELGLAIVEERWDYGATSDPGTAQFFTLVATGI